MARHYMLSPTVYAMVLCWLADGWVTPDPTARERGLAFYLARRPSN